METGRDGRSRPGGEADERWGETGKSAEGALVNYSPCGAEDVGGGAISADEGSFKRLKPNWAKN